MNASLILDKDYVLGTVDPRLYGGFMEHLGNVIYGSVYDPGHPMADEDGFRRDILALIRALNPTLVRYPGGNFVSAYNWEEGVGPLDQRKPRLDVAWKQIDPNTIGIHEFDKWAKKAGAELMMAVNLGTRGVEAARSLVEYMNHPGGSRYSDWRIENGRKDPFGVKLWCLGNEMDGPWQMGHKTADEYGRIACEAAKAMKMVDPSIELVACGSSFSSMPTFGHWEDTVLAHCMDEVDYISLHTYYGNHLDTIGDFLAQSLDMGRFIENMAALADAAAAKKKSRKRICFSFDEWNMWSQPSLAWPGMENEPRYENRREDFVYRFEDALMVGLMLMELINHADRVKIGCFTMLTSCIEEKLTTPEGRAFARAIYHPFFLASRYGRGEVIRPVLRSPVYASRYFDDVPVIASASVWRREENALSVFVVNRAEQPQALEIDLRSFGGMKPDGHDLISHPDRKAYNTGDAPDRVAPRPGPGVRQADGLLHAQVPALSFNVYHFKG